MPATSQAQYRFMQAVAHDPAFAQQAGVPPGVGQEFAQATPAPSKLPMRAKPAGKGQKLAALLRSK
jgi:hypothetical protein